jgi:hypothetical protein
MADPPGYPDSGDDRGVGPDRRSTTGTPRWVKVFGIVALVLVLLFLVLLLTGNHGPGRHSSGGGRDTASRSSVEHGLQQP